jgi:hypothetical protein
MGGWDAYDGVCCDALTYLPALVVPLALEHLLPLYTSAPTVPTLASSCPENLTAPLLFCFTVCRDLSIKALLAPPPHSHPPCQSNKARANCQLSTLTLRAHFGAAYVAARSPPALLQPFHRLHT